MRPSRFFRSSLSSAFTSTKHALALGAKAKDPTEGEEALNMQLVGYDDLQGRSAYQPIIQQQGDRWIAYIGHHAGTHLNPLTGVEEGNGTSILDVTNPENPQYIAHIPGVAVPGEESEAQMVRTCMGSDLPNGIDTNAVSYTHLTLPTSDLE